MDQTTNKPVSPNAGASLPLAGQLDTVIDITDVAVTEVNRLIEAQNLQGQHLRVGVQGGGCSGLMYSLHFDEKVNGDDQIYDIKGVKVVIDTKSTLYLQGTQVDFVHSLTGGGFKFSNPNASRSCGCGTSFSA